ncbi:hypothetical protein PsorP6_019075 [Peronosclerospora sorghi]|nr:hypothetical protein PsorP6_019075 [Peronosclerospora sorghi]
MVNIIANEKGFRTTPTFVCFEGDEVIIRDTAVKKLPSHADNTVYHLKRLIGKAHVEVKDRDFVKEWFTDGVDHAEIQRNCEKYHVDPVEFMAVLLQNLKKLAEDFKGEKLEHVVINKPEHVDDKYKVLLDAAAKKADVNVLTYIRGTNGSSNCIIPMLRVFNDTARYVDQGVGKRKGTFAIYLDPWNADVLEFLELRKNHGNELHLLARNSVQIGSAGSGQEYGEEIARLDVANTECNEACKVVTQDKLPTSLLKSAQALQRVVREHMEAARKDNANMYLENVPNFSDLPVVGKVTMVKPLVFTKEELEKEFGGLEHFEQYVPKEILHRMLGSAIQDFWHMVWQCDVHVVIILTNFVERKRLKAEMYWDSRLNQSMDFNGVYLSLDHETQSSVPPPSGIIVRRFKVWKQDISEHAKESRVIQHFQLTSWPDHGVLQDFQVIAPMLEAMNNYRCEVSGRFKRMRDAGIGRSGTFIAIDILLKKLHQALLDKSKTVEKGRERYNTRWIFRVWSIVCDRSGRAWYKPRYVFASNCFIMCTS